MNDTSHTARGISLSLITVGAWSVLPITIRIASRHLDPYTLTWYRFLVSALVLGAVLATKRNLPRAATLRMPKAVVLLVAAIVGLVVNYVLYLVSLSYVSPTVTTVITQLGPLLLMFGGVWLFHERLSKRQMFGVVLLIVGLLLFFNRKIGAFAKLTGREGFGALILLIASAAWAVYGLSQKSLLRHFTPTQILLLIYIGATVILAAFTHPLHVVTIGWLELAMLLLCAANTLVAYGALAEALKSAGAATVGAVLAVGPVATLIVTWITTRLSPGLVVPDDLNVATIVGAVVVTAGSALSARE